MLNIGPPPEGIPILYSASPGGKTLHLMAEVRVLRRDDAARGSEGLKDRKAWFVLPLAPRGADWSLLEALPPLGPNPPEGSSYPLPPNFDAGTALSDAEASLVLIAPKLCAVQVFFNRHANLLSNAGEDREAFVRRCSEALERQRQEEGDTLRKRFEQRIERIREQTERELQKNNAEDEELRLKEQESSIRDLEAGLGALFGGRRQAAPGPSMAGTGRRPLPSPEPRTQAPGQNAGFLGEQLRGLRADMDAEAQRFERKYLEMAAEVTGEIVTPERRDFRIEQLSLVWMGTNEVH